MAENSIGNVITVSFASIFEGTQLFNESNRLKRKIKEMPTCHTRLAIIHFSDTHNSICNESITG